VRAVKAWLARARALSSTAWVFPVIRGARVLDRPVSGAAVAAVVKGAAAACGLPPEAFAGHSLRSGFATAAAHAGKRPESIQAHLRHHSIAMVMRYIRREDAWRDNAAAGLGDAG
jgi:integrase